MCYYCVDVVVAVVVVVSVGTVVFHLVLYCVAVDVVVIAGVVNVGPVFAVSLLALSRCRVTSMLRPVGLDVGGVCHPVLVVAAEVVVDTAVVTVLVRLLLLMLLFNSWCCFSDWAGTETQLLLLLLLLLRCQSWMFAGTVTVVVAAAGRCKVVGWFEYDVITNENVVTMLL